MPGKTSRALRGGQRGITLVQHLRDEARWYLHFWLCWLSFFRVLLVSCRKNETVSLSCLLRCTLSDPLVVFVAELSRAGGWTPRIGEEMFEHFTYRSLRQLINFWATKEIPLQMSYLQESLRLFSSWSCILQPRIYFGRQLEQTCWLQVFFTVHCACQNNQHGKACQKHKKLLWMPIRAMGSLLHVLLAAANPISDISVQSRMLHLIRTSLQVETRT